MDASIGRSARPGRVCLGLFLVVLGGFSWTVASRLHAQSIPDVARVTVQSHWAGYSPYSPLKTDILVSRRGSGYYLTGTTSRKRFGQPEPTRSFVPRTVSGQTVAQLVALLRAQPQSQVDPAAIGLTDRQVQQAIDREWEEAGLARLPARIRAEATALRDRLRHPAPLAAILTRGFAASHTDDFPYVAVKVELSDGTTLSICSTSQQPLMLPWKNASGQPTYDAAIPRAVQALLPEGATNRERLSGKITEDELQTLVEEGLTGPVGRLRAEGEAGAALQALLDHFKVGNVMPGTWPDRKGMYLDADLQLPDGPPNLVLSTRLDVRDGALIGSNHDLARIGDALALVQASKAMTARMRAEPLLTFRMQDGWGGERLDQRTREQFVAQMTAMNKLPELRSNPDLMRGAVMVMEGKRPIYWIVLPDRRAVLWKSFGGKDAPAGMPCAGVPFGDDDDDTYLSDVCQGIVYGAEGRPGH